MEMEKDYEKNWVRLPLVFASNVRELGGYPVEEGGTDGLSQISAGR